MKQSTNMCVKRRRNYQQTTVSTIMKYRKLKNRKLYFNLIKAIQQNDEKTVEYLLTKEKINPNPIQQLFPCALDIAVKKRNLRIVQQLIANCPLPADTNTTPRGRNGLCPILHAVYNDDLPLATLLLTQAVVKVDVNCKNFTRQRREKISPLVLSILHRNMGMVKLLLEAGADVELQCVEEYSIYYSPVYYSPLTFAAKKNDLDMCKVLVEHGCDVNADQTCCAPQTNYVLVHSYPIFAAAEEGYNGVVQYLAEKGAKFCTQDEDIFERIVEHDHHETALLVLRYGSAHGFKVWKCREQLLMEILEFESCNTLRLLLQWGILNWPCPLKPIEVVRLFEEVCFCDSRRISKLLLHFNPLYLQQARRNLLKDYEHPDWAVYHPEEQAYIEDLLEQSKTPVDLKTQCRVTIFQHLGYNPEPKIKKLKLPYLLEEYMYDYLRNTP